MLPALHRGQGPVVIAQVDNHIHPVHHEAAYMIGKGVLETDGGGDVELVVPEDHPPLPDSPVGNVVALEQLVEPGEELLVQRKVLGEGHEVHLVIDGPAPSVWIEQNRGVEVDPLPFTGFRNDQAVILGTCQQPGTQVPLIAQKLLHHTGPV